MMRTFIVGTAAVIGLVAAMPAQALTMKECSAKYQEAKNTNKLKGMKWNDFRSKECGDDDADDNAAAGAVKEDPAPARQATPARPAAPAAGAAAATTPTAAPRPTGRITYPRAIDPKFADESPGRARLKTCAQQYDANKTVNANGGLRWIETGGGYWSLCNKRLKA